VRWNEVFSSIDAHVAGQPLRLITFGVPRLKNAPVRAQYAEMEQRYDHMRIWLLTEPRGYTGMTGAILLPPGNLDVDYGVIFMSGGGYTPLSGHGVIALATTLIETGSVPIDGPDTRITFDTYLGPIQARASVDQGRVRNVRFRNVPSFRMAHDLAIEVNNRRLSVDVAYGGNWYAIVDAEDLGVSLEPAHSAELSRLGNAVLRATSNEMDIVHPEDPDVAGLYGVVIRGAPKSEDSSSRNVTIYSGGLIDRSPCATGMAATMACMAADGELSVSDSFVSESIVDTTMTGRIVVGTEVGEYPAVTVEIAARGAVTGMHQFFINPAEVTTSGFMDR
jgi:proline racemase